MHQTELSELPEKALVSIFFKNLPDIEGDEIDQDAFKLAADALVELRRRAIVEKDVAKLRDAQTMLVEMQNTTDTIKARCEMQAFVERKLASAARSAMVLPPGVAR